MEEKHIIKIISVTQITPDVKCFKVTKPKGYSFIPGQATEISINQEGWKTKRNPFTFTSLNEWDHLEFTIKIYKGHDGVTKQLDLLQPGDELIIHDVWGAIQYKGAGVFIAGGAGITPFIAIFRQLYKDGKIDNNTLLFSNKTAADIVLKQEFTQMLGDHFINILTKEKLTGYEHTRIDEHFLARTIKNFHQQFYICGPDEMIQSVKVALQKLGGNSTPVTIEL